MRILVSVAVKTGVLAVIVVQNGMLSSKVVEEFKFDGSTNHTLLKALRRTMLIVRNYLSQNTSVDCVDFEINNATVATWLMRGFCKDDYIEDLHEVLNILNELPIKYSFIASKVPKAMGYCKKSSIKKIKLSSLEV